MTHSPPRYTTIAVAVLVLVTGLTTPVAAQSSQSPVDELFTDEDGNPVSPVENPQAFVSNILSGISGVGAGLPERAAYEVSEITGSDNATDLDTEANETIDTLNSNSGTIIDHINNQTTFDESQLHAVQLADEGSGDQSTFYVDLTYNTTADQYESLEATDTQPSNTTVDEEHRFRGQLAQNINEETTHYIENYAAAGETPLGDGQYISRMASQYGGVWGNQFESTLLDGGWGGLEDDGDGDE